MAYLLRMFLIFLAMTSISAQNYVRKSREARDRMRELEQRTEVVEKATKNPQVDVVISNPRKPEITRVLIQDLGTEGNLGEAGVRDVYEKEYMASGVVGLVGVPVRVSYENSNASPRLVFYYNPNELRGIPERNLIILHEGQDGFYYQVGEETMIPGDCSISVEIPEEGIYMVADRYQWYSVWGEDVSEYAYEVNPLDYKSDWERQCDVGSIMDIADREWAMENAPVFHVSTPEQLAGVVYYNNAVVDYATGEGSVYVYLENDIDLEGYDWVPMGWMGAGNNRFDGLFDGQGHTISNLRIDQPNLSHVAFIGYSTGVTVCNVNFENACVIGGSYTGIVGGEIYISKEWENVNVNGVIEDAYGEVGSIIGREAGLNFKNCSADVVYRRGGTERKLEYFSHRLEVVANTPVTEDFQLTLEEDGSVTRTTSEGNFRNLCWHLDVEGVVILQRGAENETNFNAKSFFADYLEEGRKCQIWLEAFTGETYTRVSNVIEY